MPWIEEMPLANARARLAAATSDAPAPGYGYRIYALGGLIFPAGGTTVATVEAYDTMVGGWSPVAPLGVPRSYLAATSGPDGLHALGGQAFLPVSQAVTTTKSTMRRRTPGRRRLRS